MGSSKNKICKIFAIILLNLYLRLATATNIDCNGKSFHCVNSTHFMICVDFGGGVSITVNDFVIQCPPTTVCGENNHLECTYQMPATTQTNIHPGDETSDFTTDTQIITTTSSDITNTISTIDKTRMTALFHEHYNTIEVTTYANYAPDVQTYTHDVSGIPEILNHNRPLSDNHSNVLTATTDLYSAENSSAKSPENHSTNEKIISNVVTTVKDIARKTDSPDLNSESFSMKLMDSLHDAPTKALAQNVSIVIDQEVNTAVANQLTPNYNNEINTKLLRKNIVTTETTLPTHYPRVQENHNFENTSTTVNKTNQGVEQKLTEIDNSFVLVNATQINSLATKKENGSLNIFLTSTENSNFNSTKTGNEIELSKDADLIYPKIGSTKLINALYPSKLNLSDITEAYHVTNMPSKLELTITPSRYLTETVLVTTESGISYNDKEMLMSSKSGTTPTLYSSTISENEVSDTLELKSTTSISESTVSEGTTIFGINELGKETQKIKVETNISSPHLNDNTSLPDGPLEGPSNITTNNLYFDYRTSTIDYRSKMAELFLEQKFLDDKFKESNPNAQQISEVILQEDISTTQANMADLLVNTTSNSVNNYSTSLQTTSDSTINSIEHTNGSNEATKITEAYSTGTLRKSSQVSTEMSSSIYPIPFNYNAFYSENITAKEMNTSARDKYNSSYQNLMTTPQININDQHVETLVTQTTHYATEYNKLLSQEETMLQVTDNPYSADTTLSSKNRLSSVYINKQEIEDNKTYISSPHEQYKSEAFFYENVTNPESHDFSVNTASSLSDYDFTTTSLLSAFEQGTEKEQVTSRKETIGRSKIPYHNTILHTNVLDNENAIENSTQVTLNSMQFKNRNSDIKQIAIKDTTPTFQYENSTYKPTVQGAMQKILYDTQIEKTKPSYNSRVIKDSITQMELNTKSTRDNHNTFDEFMKTTPQLNINSQVLEITVPEASCNSSECNKFISQENVHMTKNHNSNDAFLNIENIILNFKLNIDDQQEGDNITYTSTQQEHYKSEFVSENNSKMNRKTKDLSVSTESSLPNFDFITPSLISTLDQTSEIKQVTDEITAIEGTTISYINLTDNENATEKLSLVILNSTRSEYRTSNINEIMQITPMQNITQKILYETKIDNIDLGPVKDSIIVSTPGLNDVVSNIKISESTTIKSESMATFDSVPELVTRLQIGKIDEVHTLNYSDFISRATSLPQDGRNMLIGWRNIISPSVEHSITSKKNIVDLNRLTVDSADSVPVNFTEIITNITDNINNTSIDKLEHKKPSEIVLHTSIEKFPRENKSADTINEIFNVGQTSSNPEIYGGTHTTQITTQNEEAFTDIMKLTSQNHNNHTTENLLWENYNLTQTETLILNENITSSTSKPLIMTSVTGIDETLSLSDQITLELVTKSYLATDTPKDIIINTTNKNNFIHVQDNNDKFTDQLRNDQTKQHFNETFRSNNDPNTNTTNKILFKKPYEHYFSSNFSSHNFGSFKLNEEAKTDVILERNLNLNTTPPEIVENVHDTYTVTPKVKTNNFTNEQSNVFSDNFPVHFYNKNDSIKRDYMVNDIVTRIPKLDVYNNLSYTVVIKNTVNKNRIKTAELNTTSEDQVSNKESMVLTNKILTHGPTVIMGKTNASHEDRITVKKAPLNTQFFFDLPSSTAGEIKSRDIDVTGNLYMEENKFNDTLKEHNSTGVASNTTEHSQILNLPIQYLRSAVPFRPLVSLENSEQVSLAQKLNKTDGKDGLNINNQNGSKYNVAAIDQTKRDEVLTVKPIVTINVIKKNLDTPNLLKKNNTNVGMKPYKRSTNSALFRCNYRSRGRFADKNNCRKYYICIGLKEPILGECPTNTVFSEIKKQCTKNLAHCIRNNQFRCAQEGRFSDVLRSNIYYICVHYNNTYVRFQFQCQNGFHLNKTSVRCVKDIKYQFLSQIVSLSADSLSNKGSDQSTVESQIKERKLSQENTKYTCTKEGKFPDEEDCRRYYVCTKNSKSVFRRRTKKCDSDEVFHREKKKCVDNDSYECY